MIKTKFYLHRVLVAIFISLIFFSTAYTLPPEPNYGVADVDGNNSEWNLTNDFFADMYLAGNPANPVKSYLYLRYDSISQIMFVLVLPKTGAVVDTSATNTWIAIDGISNKVVNGNDIDDGISPDFAWIDRGFDGNNSHARGWEASFPISPGTYTIIGHNQILEGIALSGSTTDIKTSRNGINLVVNDVFITNPSIDVEKYLAESQTGPWLTTDGQPGHQVAVGTNIYFKFFMANNGNVNLTNVSLTDSDFTLSSCSPAIPNILLVGESYECIIGPFSATADQHTNIATAQGEYNATTYTHTDSANYYGTAVNATIGNEIWNDLNANGIKEAGDGPIEGVTVNLYSCGDNTLVATACTCEHSKYTFLVNPDSSYYLEVILPAAYRFSPQDQGVNDQLDSDFNPADGKTRCIDASELEPGNEYLMWDAGLYIPPHIGGDVWQDYQANGIHDLQESGIAGITTNLYKCVGDTFVSSTTTDSDGFYEFINLFPGDYYLKFMLTGNYIFTLQNQGTNEIEDSDADRTTGETECTNLTSGENDLTWHAGFIDTSSPVRVDLQYGNYIIFSRVSDLCSSSASIISLNNSPVPAPQGYTFISLYEIDTCATYTGTIDVTIPYNASAIQGSESNLRLFHLESGTWRDVTISLDTINNTITGRVTSLSPFGCGYPYSSVGSDSSDNSYPGGRRYSTGINENMITLIVILAITGGILILRKNRWFRKT